MTEVEHHPDVVALAFAGHPHGIAEGVYVKAGMRIEHDTQAGLLGLVGDFPYEGDGLLVGVGFLAPLDEQLENGIPSLEVLDRLANFLAIAVPVGSQSAPYVKAEEFEPRLVVELETLENGKVALGQLGRADPVVAQFLQDLYALRSGLEVNPVLEGVDGPALRLGGKLRDEEKKREECNDILHEWIEF